MVAMVESQSTVEPDPRGRQASRVSVFGFLQVPREHGFWVMLAAVLWSAAWRAGYRWDVVLLAFGVAALTSLIGGQSARYVRRHPSAQVGVGVLLAALGVPVELLVGTPLREAALRGVCFTAVFAASALAVRAAFERPGTRRLRLELASLVVPLVLSALLAPHALREAVGALLAAIAAAAVMTARPSTKDLKSVGLALALLAAIVVTFLNLQVD